MSKREWIEWTIQEETDQLVEWSKNGWSTNGKRFRREGKRVTSDRLQWTQQEKVQRANHHKKRPSRSASSTDTQQKYVAETLNNNNSDRLDLKTYAADWVQKDSEKMPSNHKIILGKVVTKITKENEPMMHVIEWNDSKVLNIRYDYFSEFENKQNIRDVLNQFQEKWWYLPLVKKTVTLKKKESNTTKEVASYEIDTEFLELIDTISELDEPVGRHALNYPLSWDWYTWCICWFDIHKNPLVYTKKHGVTILEDVRDDVTPKYGEYVDLCLNKSKNSGSVVTHCCYSAVGSQGKSEWLHQTWDTPQVTQWALITSHPLKVDEGFAVQREQIRKEENLKKSKQFEAKTKNIIKALFQQDNNPYFTNHPAEHKDNRWDYHRLSPIELSVLDFWLSDKQIQSWQKVWSKNGVPGVIIDPAKDENGEEITIDGQVRVKYFRYSKTWKKWTTIAMTSIDNLWWPEWK